jgi:hypothetical protein
VFSALRRGAAAIGSASLVFMAEGAQAPNMNVIVAVKRVTTRADFLTVYHPY